MSPKLIEPVGSYQAPGYWRSKYLRLLTENYRQNVAFMAELKSLAESFSGVWDAVKEGMQGQGLLADAFEVDSKGIPYSNKAFPSTNIETLAHWNVTFKGLELALIRNETTPVLSEALHLYQRANDIAEAWGLNADWGAGLILWNLTRSWISYCETQSPQFWWTHEGGYDIQARTLDLRKLKATLGHQAECLPDEITTDYSPVRTTTVILTLRYDPQNMKRDDFEKLVLAEARAEMDAIESCMEQTLEYTGGKSFVDDHIKWLYEKICPQPSIERTYSWNEIAKKHNIGIRTVRSAVEPLADELQLRLPKLPGGRPRESVRISV